MRIIINSIVIFIITSIINSIIVVIIIIINNIIAVIIIINQNKATLPFAFQASRIYGTIWYMVFLAPKELHT